MLITLSQSVPVLKPRGNPVTTLEKKNTNIEENEISTEENTNENINTEGSLGKEIQMNENFVKAVQPFITYLQGLSRAVISGDHGNFTNNKTLPINAVILKRLMPVLELFINEIPSLVLGENQETNAKVIDDLDHKKFTRCDDDEYNGFRECQDTHGICSLECLNSCFYCFVKHCKNSNQ